MSDDAEITITDSAWVKIAALTKGDPSKGLRIHIVGGGCSGLQYDMKLDVENDTDFKYEKDGAMVLVDHVTMQKLLGSEVDYEEDLRKSGFVIKNPNAAGECGCGSSFST